MKLYKNHRGSGVLSAAQNESTIFFWNHLMNTMPLICTLASLTSHCTLQLCVKCLPQGYKFWFCDRIVASSFPKDCTPGNKFNERFLLVSEQLLPMYPLARQLTSSCANDVASEPAVTILQLSDANVLAVQRTTGNFRQSPSAFMVMVMWLSAKLNLTKVVMRAELHCLELRQLMVIWKQDSLVRVYFRAGSWHRPTT